MARNNLYFSACEDVHKRAITNITEQINIKKAPLVGAEQISALSVPLWKGIGVSTCIIHQELSGAGTAFVPLKVLYF